MELHATPGLLVLFVWGLCDVLAAAGRGLG